MRDRFRPRKDTTSWFFDRVFPKLFIGIFVVVILLFLVQVVIIGWAGYQVISDPEGSARAVGAVAAEVIKPVADAVRGE